MIIDLNPDLPSIDVAGDPGRVMVVTTGKLIQEWGRIEAEQGEFRYAKARNGVYDLESIDLELHLARAERWRVELSRGREFAFYFTAEGITFSYEDEGEQGILFQIRCPQSAFSGWQRPALGPIDEGQPRFERVG